MKFEITLSTLLPLLFVACRATEAPGAGDPDGPASAEVSRVGRDMVVCGERIHVGAPIVLWSDPGGYDGTSTSLRFGAAAGAEVVPDGELRYQPGRVSRDGMREVLVPPGSTDRALVGETVDQLVLHYDVCGTSRTCFKVLHDHRGLSCHFLLDVDGTLYQTLDLRDQAWHATKANVRSIGVEIANIGAYPPGRPSPLDDWYLRDEGGLRLQLPEGRPSGVRREGFVGRPIRSDRVKGTINGGLYEMVDLTPEQYDSLVKLTAALCRTFPRLRPEVPRTSTGEVVTEVLEDPIYDTFRGILGHFHVQRNKADPGPAFQWEPYLARVKARLVSDLP